MYNDQNWEKLQIFICEKLKLNFNMMKIFNELNVMNGLLVLAQVILLIIYGYICQDTMKKNKK